MSISEELKKVDDITAPQHQQLFAKVILRWFDELEQRLAALEKKEAK